MLDIDEEDFFDDEDFFSIDEYVTYMAQPLKFQGMFVTAAQLIQALEDSRITLS